MKPFNPNDDEDMELEPADETTDRIILACIIASTFYSVVVFFLLICHAFNFLRIYN
jgi:hypothetical protein